MQEGIECYRWGNRMSQTQKEKKLYLKSQHFHLCRIWNPMWEEVNRWDQDVLCNLSKEFGLYLKTVCHCRVLSKGVSGVRSQFSRTNRLGSLGKYMHVLVLALNLKVTIIWLVFFLFHALYCAAKSLTNAHGTHVTSSREPSHACVFLYHVIIQIFLQVGIF